MLLLWVLGCTVPLEGVFVGDIPTTPSVLAALYAGETKVGVVIAGEAETLSWSRYFEGPRAEDGSFQLSADGWSLTGTEVAGGGGFSLELTDPDGAGDPAFTLQPPIDPSSYDGPFVGTSGGCVPSGVVYNSGGQIRGAACTSDGTRVPLSEPQEGLALSGSGTIEVEADLGSGPETLVLEQVLLE